MSEQLNWVLPQGIEETLPEESARLETLRRRILDMYSAWGYDMVMPPMVDHIESLTSGTGRDLSLHTFKFVDQVSGRTLGIRADMTTQVARIDAARLKHDAPTRLCYIGTVLRALPDSFGSSRSPMQVGAELYGHAGIESEAEVITLMLNTFRVAGVSDVYIDLGNVDIFRRLAEQAGLDSQTEGALFEMLQRKAIPDIEDLLSSSGIGGKVRSMLIELAKLNGGEEVLERAATALQGADEGVMKALSDLKRIADLVRKRNEGVSLHFDLAELHGYHYKTGIVFAAFVPGSGQAIARGGRYDQVGEVFGRARAATGFSTDIKVLDRCSSKRDGLPRRILAPVSDDEALIRRIDELRGAGELVVEQLSGQSFTADELGCDRQLVNEGGNWVVQAAS